MLRYRPREQAVHVPQEVTRLRRGSSRLGLDHIAHVKGSDFSDGPRAPQWNKFTAHFAGDMHRTALRFDFLSKPSFRHRRKRRLPAALRRKRSLARFLFGVYAALRQSEPVAGALAGFSERQLGRVTQRAARGRAATGPAFVNDK